MFNVLLRNKKFVNFFSIIIFFLISSLGPFLSKFKPPIYQSVFYLKENNMYNEKVYYQVFNYFVKSNEFGSRKLNVDYIIQENFVLKNISLIGSEPENFFNAILAEFKINNMLAVTNKVFEKKFKSCIRLNDQSQKLLPTFTKNFNATQNLDEDLYIRKILAENQILSNLCKSEESKYGGYITNKIIFDTTNDNKELFNFISYKKTRQISGVAYYQGVTIFIIFAFLVAFVLRLLIFKIKQY